MGDGGGGLVVVVVVVGVALIIALGNSLPITGYDACYPLCSGSYPSNPLFGIVGVNDGLATNANPCMSGELRWARDTPGRSARTSHPSRCTSTPLTPARTTSRTGRAAVPHRSMPLVTAS